MPLRLSWCTDCSTEDDQDWLKRVGPNLYIVLLYFVLYCILFWFYCDKSRSQSVSHCIVTFSMLLINFVKNRFMPWECLALIFVTRMPKYPGGRYSLFWVHMQRTCVVRHRRFGTWPSLCRNFGNYISTLSKHTQKSEDLTHTRGGSLNSHRSWRNCLKQRDLFLCGISERKYYSGKREII
jgi:hypothetical protein